MKTFYVLIATLFLSISVKAQLFKTGIFQILLDTKQMSGTCNLSAADTVYMHSGLGWSNPDSLWQSIVGNWGIDNGKGEMTSVGNGVYSICFNVIDYYTNLASQDSTSPTGEGYGPMPAGETPYNLGIVFRKASCPYSQVTHHNECTAAQTGKDENCDNLYILRIDQPKADSTIDPANIEDASGNNYPAITAQYVSTCADAYVVPAGITDLNPTFQNAYVYPMPFNNTLYIDFISSRGVKPKVEIFDLVGDKVADLSSRVTDGQNKLLWNAKDASGTDIAAGFYLVRISSGGQIYTAKVIKQ